MNTMKVMWDWGTTNMNKTAVDAASVAATTWLNNKVTAAKPLPPYSTAKWDNITVSFDGKLSYSSLKITAADQNTLMGIVNAYKAAIQTEQNRTTAPPASQNPPPNLSTPDPIRVAIETVFLTMADDFGQEKYIMLGEIDHESIDAVTPVPTKTVPKQIEDGAIATNGPNGITAE